MRQNPDGTSGLVEICNDGVWRPLAASSMTTQVADVICRRLSFFSGHFSTFTSFQFSLNAPVYAPSLPCGGNESSLNLCVLREQRRRKRITDSDSQQAGVRCNGMFVT